MDLPKGLVKDDRRIYEDVAALTQPLPPDFIIRMWRRKSTAARGTPRFNSQHESDPILSAQQMNQDIKMISEQSALKELSASSSRPPPPHPILKKHRGDSKSGPRPTARFVSPHESADEDYQTSDETSSGSTGASGLEMRTSSAVSPAKSSKKKPSTPTKRFVASAAAYPDQKDSKCRLLVPKPWGNDQSKGLFQNLRGRKPRASARALEQNRHRSVESRSWHGQSWWPQDAYVYTSCITRALITKSWVIFFGTFRLFGAAYGARTLEFRVLSTEGG
ncbi:uncharacterized protein N0V96_010460 [Colletotrichum fioriniae]|uniref:uncharacterized protein n=1 Tax=Colletotrichum fioriniae TaxID=710243 RepID=UPI0032DB3A1A|nr:hypothetical protein N0V96_010460 [Colletotrichum fioriniae]